MRRLLPFFGVCHVGYLPKGRVIGLSKIPRLVTMFAHRLQLQERMTKEIAEALSGAVEPRGVGVVVEARHLCMEMRGIQKAGGPCLMRVSACSASPGSGSTNSIHQVAPASLYGSPCARAFAGSSLELFPPAAISKGAALARCSSMKVLISRISAGLM